MILQLFQRVLPVTMCMSITKNTKNNSMGFYFFKNIFWWTYNQGRDDYI